MKKIYLLSLLCCLSIAAIAQSTIQIYPVGGVGSYVTGNSDGVSRNDNNIVTSTTPSQSGYAVFDLSVIPPGATIQSCTINFNTATYSGGGTPTAWNTFGYVGDLSTVTTPAILYSDMMTGGTSISTASYGSAVGNQTLASSALITNFVTANMSGAVSIAFTGGGTRIYTITGESGILGTSGAHKPYLEVTYCTVPTSVTATATNPVCTGQTLLLSGSASILGGGGGTLTYAWKGPGGYSAGGAGPSLTAALTSAGVYTLTATHTCLSSIATTSVTTTSVVVNQSPGLITGSGDVCTTNTTLLSDTAGGVWSSSNTLLATVNPLTGLVSGKAVGFPTISYTIPSTGCFALWSMTVNAPPGAISGLTKVCQNYSIILTESSVTGAWSSGNTTIASVSVAGDVTGSDTAYGAVTIDYTVAGCPAATYPITVEPKPGPIGGGGNVCIGFSTPTILTDPFPGGMWTSTNTTVNIFTSRGVTDAYGVTVGTDTIIYTVPSTGCADSEVVSVLVGPGPIIGPIFVVCQNSTIPLTDDTLSGAWSSGSATANVNPASGIVTGESAGTAIISYTSATTGCYSTQKVTVNAQPAAMTPASPTICSNDSILLNETDPSGVWSSSSTALATVDTNGLVKGVSSGGVTISYTFPSTGCYNTDVVSINPAPVVAITASGPTTFCGGGSVTLSVPTGAGGTTYQWYDAGIAIAGANTTSYTTSTSQSLTVQVENGFSCIATSATDLVISGLSVTIASGGITSFCLGGGVVLTATPGSPAGVISYQWQLNGAAIPAANANKFDATVTGLYDCLVTVSGGGSGSCSATTTSVNVTASPIPVPPVTITKTTEGTQFTTGAGYKGYEWFLNTKSIAGATSNTYTAVVNGSYRVAVTDSNGCSGYSTEYVINNVGVAQVNTADIKIYPNPASSTIHVTSPVNVRAVVTSMEGKTLIDKVNAKDIDISSLANGLYIIILYDDNGERVTLDKLIKE